MVNEESDGACETAEYVDNPDASDLSCSQPIIKSPDVRQSSTGICDLTKVCVRGSSSIHLCS